MASHAVKCRGVNRALHVCSALLVGLIFILMSFQAHASTYSIEFDGPGETWTTELILDGSDPWNIEDPNNRLEYQTRSPTHVTWSGGERIVNQWSDWSDWQQVGPYVPPSMNYAEMRVRISSPTESGFETIRITSPGQTFRFELTTGASDDGPLTINLGDFFADGPSQTHSDTVTIPAAGQVSFSQAHASAEYRILGERETCIQCFMMVGGVCEQCGTYGTETEVIQGWTSGSSHGQPGDWVEVRMSGPENQGDPASTFDLDVTENRRATMSISWPNNPFDDGFRDEFLGFGQNFMFMSATPTIDDVSSSRQAWVRSRAFEITGISEPVTMVVPAPVQVLQNGVSNTVGASATAIDVEDGDTIQLRIRGDDLGFFSEDNTIDEVHDGHLANVCIPDQPTSGETGRLCQNYEITFAFQDEFETREWNVALIQTEDSTPQAQPDSPIAGSFESSHDNLPGQTVTSNSVLIEGTGSMIGLRAMISDNPDGRLTRTGTSLVVDGVDTGVMSLALDLVENETAEVALRTEIGTRNSDADPGAGTLSLEAAGFDIDWEIS